MATETLELERFHQGFKLTRNFPILPPRDDKIGVLVAEMCMADIIAFTDLRNSAKQDEILSLFENKPAIRQRRRKAHKQEDFPTCRPGISGNLNDLYEQANAVLMRHYDGDTKVPVIVAKKCFELLKALSEHAEPE